MLKKLVCLFLILIGGAIVSISLIEFIPIAIVTHYFPGLIIGIIGTLVGGMVSALGCYKFFGIPRGKNDTNL